MSAFPFRQMHVNELYPRWLVAWENSRKFHLIDVRTPAEHARVRVPDSRLLPLAALSARISEVPRDDEVYLICHSGVRSARAADFLARQFGYDNLSNVEGGVAAWTQAGYPVIRK
ncbi:MAG: rhodanese-like domain-containing protein [Mariprofundaceae bacterium]|nr:rhodanese-like domain-containing protein [Mariprofundaceae bacterium]